MLNSSLAVPQNFWLVYIHLFVFASSLPTLPCTYLIGQQPAFKMKAISDHQITTLLRDGSTEHFMLSLKIHVKIMYTHPKHFDRYTYPETPFILLVTDMKSKRSQVLNTTQHIPAEQDLRH